MRKICIVTGSRAEWGLLSRLAGLIRDDQELQLQIIATNMHLSERYGSTYKEIEAAGFRIDCLIPMETVDDQARGTVDAMAAAMGGFSEAYEQLRPDMLLVLGDRYEILVAVVAALIFKIPVVHLHGGEITQGAYDDAIRHAITKMSHLHFTSTETYRQRVIQMGESPETVFNVGAIGVDNIMQIPLWGKLQTEESLGGFVLDNQTVLATYHPVTLEDNTGSRQMDELLGAFDAIPQLRVIFTMPNSDTGNRVISDKIIDWCQQNSHRSVWFQSLGVHRYLSVLQYIAGVVGNSSSGIIEVPCFGIPTVDIGDRQKGRIAAVSVVHCPPLKNCIIQQLWLLLNKEIPVIVPEENPYYKPDTAAVILTHIKTSSLEIHKLFYDK